MEERGLTLDAIVASAFSDLIGRRWQRKQRTAIARASSAVKLDRTPAVR
jgi:hypothetical protein